MNTLAHIPSNMTNEECFRLTGALPTARIADLLEEGARFNDAAKDVSAQLETINDAFPCEGFADDIMYRLARLRDNDAGDEETELDLLVDAVRQMMADQWARTKDAQTALRAVEDALSEWGSE